MKIAILADSHDHLENLRKVLEAVRDTDELIHCGDLIAPFSVIALASQYNKPIHFVWGNNDGDHANCQEKAREFPHFKIYGDEATMEIENKKFAASHYPEPAEKFAQSGQFDLVCFGHTHKVDLRVVDKTTVVNPGDVMGRFDSKAHFAIYDTETGKIELKEIEASPA